MHKHYARMFVADKQLPKPVWRGGAAKNGGEATKASETLSKRRTASLTKDRAPIWERSTAAANAAAAATTAARAAAAKKPVR